MSVVLLVVAVLHVVHGDPPCPAFPVAVPLPASAFSSLGERIDAMLGPALAKENVTGFIATVVYDQDIVWSKGYGRRDFRDVHSSPPALDDLLRVASITKVWTSLLAYVLRDKGVVDLDDDVLAYLPDFAIRNPFPSRRPTTLRQLMSHVSGLPRDLPPKCFFNPECTEEQVFTTLKDRYLVLPPNTRFHYSNVGFALLGRALAQAALGTSSAYSKAMNEALLEPLGISGGLDYSNTSLLARLAYGNAGGGRVGSRTSIGWLAPCGDLLASARDLSRLIAFMFRNHALPSAHQPLDGATVSEALNPQVLLRDEGEAVGFPWEMKYVAGHAVKSKQGELEGYRSSVSIVPELKLGVFFSALVSDVSEESVWTLPALDLAIPHVEEALWARQPKAVLPPAFKQYLGKYAGYDDVTVQVQTHVRGDVLVASFASGTAYNLTSIASAPEAHALLAVQMTPIVGCRWVDDGRDHEVMYFSVAAGGPAASLDFNGAEFKRTA